MQRTPCQLSTNVLLSRALNLVRTSTNHAKLNPIFLELQRRLLTLMTRDEQHTRDLANQQRYFDQILHHLLTTRNFPDSLRRARELTVARFYTTKPYNSQCTYCLSPNPNSYDHVLPITAFIDMGLHLEPGLRASFQHALVIVPACTSCNSLAGNSIIPKSTLDKLLQLAQKPNAPASLKAHAQRQEQLLQCTNRTQPPTTTSP